MKTLLIATLLIALGNPSLEPAFQEEEERASAGEEMRGKKLRGQDIQIEREKDIRNYRYDVPPEGQILNEENEDEEE